MCAVVISSRLRQPMDTLQGRQCGIRTAGSASPYGASEECRDFANSAIETFRMLCITLELSLFIHTIEGRAQRYE